MNLHYLPLAKPDESPTSMIRRTAIHNGYSSCTMFMRHFLGTSYYNHLLFQEGELARKLAEQARPYDKELLKGFYQVKLKANNQTRIISLHNITIPNALLRYSEAAICTDCWQEELENKIKDLRSSSYCLRHRKQYLSYCLSCGRHFTWYNQITIKCICGTPIQSPSVSSADVYPESLVASLLGSESQERLDLFSQTLTTMDFYASKQKDPVRNRNIVKTAIGLALNDLELCAEALANLSNTSSTRGNAMLLAKLPSSPDQIDAISKILAKKTKTFSQSCTETLNTEQVKKVIKVSEAHWNKIQAHPKFPRTSRTRPRYDNSDINTILAIYEDIRIHRPHTYEHELISLRECYATLKMPKPNFSNLCKQGFFGPTFQLGAATQHFFEAAKFEVFHREYISVWQLAQEYSLNVLTVRKIISKGKLNTIKTDRYVSSTSPLASFIKRKDIAAFNQFKESHEADAKLTAQAILHGCPALPTSMSTLVLSSHDAALHLRTHRKYIYALIHKGFLDAYRKGRELHVTLDSFKKLRQEFMTGTELAKHLDIHCAYIPQVLAHHGLLDLAIVLPYCQVQYLYRRSDFTEERLATLNPSKSDYGRARQEKKLIRVSKVRQEFEIIPHEFHKITFHIFNARPEHYRTERHRRYLSESEANRIRRFIGTLRSVSTLSVEYGVSQVEIECRFIRNNSIESLCIGTEHYISKVNYKVLDQFYASNFTLKQASKITGLPGSYLQGLLMKKAIKASKIPLGGHPTPTMISIKALRKAISRYKRNGSKLLHLKLANL